MLGEVVGSYRIIDRIGEGGMGAVFLAEHVTIGRRAALKMLLPEHSREPTIVARFFNEARATSLIEHPGLITVFDFGNHTDGAAYIVMEFLQGESLGKRLREQGVLPPELLVPVARQIASALAAAHGAGIVHRDLKPDNVFLVPDREVAIGLRVKVLDFGIAKLIGDPHAAPMQRTSTGAVMGTPLYMSPEQCRGAGDVDARSDVYSLGCIMFEAAVGQPPFLGEGAGDVLAAHLRDAPPRPSSLAPGIPAALEALILKALAKDPAARQQSMRELEEALDGLADRLGVGSSGRRAVPVVTAPGKRAAILTTQGSAAGESLPGTLMPPVRSPARVAVMMAGGLAVLGLGIGAYWKWGRGHGGSAGAAVPGPVAVASPDAGAASRPVVTPLGLDAALAVAPPDAAPVAAAAPDAAPPAVAPPDQPTPDQPTPERIKLAITSEPPRAEVLLDGRRVGRTPFQKLVERGSGKLGFVVRCGGYADATVVLSPASARQHVALKRLPGTPFGVNCE